MKIRKVNIKRRIARTMLSLICVHALSVSTLIISCASTPVIDQYFQQKVTVNAEKGTAVFEDSMMSNYFSTDNQGGKLTGTVVYSGVTFYYDADNELAIESLCSQLMSADQASMSVRQISNDIGLVADTSSGTAILAPAIPYVNIGLGIIVVLINMGMTVYTACDILLLTNPTFQGFCNGISASGGEGVNPHMVKQTKDGGVKFRFTTDEALETLSECAVGSGKNKTWAYLRKRGGAIIGCGVMLMILVTGNIDIITTFVLNIIGGFFKIFISMQQG